MSPEKDILLSHAPDSYHQALVNIFYTYYYLVDKMNDAFKEHDVTRQQFNVLQILRAQHPLVASVNLIKARLPDKMSDVSRIVERLRIKGFVARESAAGDKRSVAVSITQKGLALVCHLDPEINRLGNLISNLTVEETVTLNKVLDKIRGKDKDAAFEDFSVNPSKATAFNRNR